MRNYVNYATATEAEEKFERLKKLEAEGKVRDVWMGELSEKVRLPHEKPYLVSWHTWGHD